VLGVLTNGEPLDLEVSFDRAGDFRRCSIAMRARMTGQGGVSGAILSVMDVTERERLRAEVQRQARFDLLTGLLNRGAILETLENALSRLKPGGGIAVLFIDLDGFKQINDEFGHAAGDALLRCVGTRLEQAMRAQDTAGRLGGDEFVVVREGVDSSADALAIGTRIHATLTAPTIIGTRHVVPGSSIGVAWTGVAVDQDVLVARADGAMYQAKSNKAGPMLSTI
jgi:diguanylate cyclase (GGDEF)-like protein